MTDDPPLEPPAKRQIDGQVERFIDEWKRFFHGENGSERPDIAQYLDLGDIDAQARVVLFRYLLDADVYYRKKKGEKPVRQDYLQQFPDLRGVIHRELPDSEIPERLGSYRVVEVLGQGEFGTVYRAFDEKLNRDVAIKVPRPGRSIQMFSREAKILARLDHPNIVPVYAWGETDDGQGFIVSKYIDGSDLTTYVTKFGIEPNRAAELIAIVAEALAYAHHAQRRIYHRDIKPANILVDNSGTPYLSDLGIALTAEEYGQQPCQAGTLPYMSPEQVRFDSHLVDGRSDVFSLGVVLYELLTGVRPFSGTRQELTERIQTLDPMRPSELNPGVPRDLEAICLKAISKRREDRYIAGDLASNLWSYLHAANVRHHLGSDANREDEVILTQLADRVRGYWVDRVLKPSLASHNTLVLPLAITPGLVSVPMESSRRRNIAVDAQVVGDPPPSLRITDACSRFGDLLLVAGEPGAGKSTLLLMLADAMLRGVYTTNAAVPVILNLSSWTPSLTLHDWIVEELRTKYYVPSRLGRDMLTHQRLMLLLDGLDEVRDSVREECVVCINEYLLSFGAPGLLVGSRLAEYEALASRLKLNGAVCVEAPREESIRSYLIRESGGTESLANRVTTDAGLQRLSRVPLFLTLLVRVISGLGDTNADRVTVSKMGVLDRYVEFTYQNRGDSGNGNHENRVKCVAQWLARNMQLHGMAVFLIENLQPTWLRSRFLRLLYLSTTRLAEGIIFGSTIGVAMGIGQGAIVWGAWGGVTALLVDRPERLTKSVSIKEANRLVFGFLSASVYFFSSLLWISAVYVVPGFIYSDNTLKSTTISRGMLFLCFLGLVSFVNASVWWIFWELRGLLSQSKVDIQFGRYSRWSWKHGARGCALGMLIGLPLVLISMVMCFVPNMLFLAFPPLAIGAIVFPIVGFLASGARPAIPSAKLRPNYGVWMNLRRGVRCWCIASILLGVLSWVVFLSANPLSAAEYAKTTLLVIVGCSPIALWFGLRDILRHFVLRACLWLSDAIPVRIVRYLDGMVDSGLLRGGGGAYQFIHEIVREHVARRV